MSDEWSTPARQNLVDYGGSSTLLRQHLLSVSMDELVQAPLTMLSNSAWSLPRQQGGGVGHGQGAAEVKTEDSVVISVSGNNHSTPSMIPYRGMMNDLPRVP